MIGWIRLFIVLIGVFSTYKLYNYGGLIYGIITALAFVFIFLVVAIIHGNKIKDIVNNNIRVLGQKQTVVHKVVSESMLFFILFNYFSWKSNQYEFRI